MKKRWKVISAVVTALFLLTLAAVPALAQTTATRDIADQTLAPGESTNVTVTINNAQIQALGLDENPPAGWTVAEVDSGGGMYNATNIEWFWMQAAAGTITVIYNLTVPLGTADGTYPIAGTLLSGEGTVAVGGEAQITVSGVAVATTATRDIADQTLAPGENTDVTVTINNAQIQALGLDEDAPAGWPVAEVDNGGAQYNATEIEWFWMQAAAGTITVIYNLTVPLGTADGTYPIAGTLLSGEGTVAVGGETQITVSGVAVATTATRDIADQTLAPGESTDVTVTIDNPQLQGLGLDEDPPVGWAVAEVLNGGAQYNAALIEWFWMQAAAGTIPVIYNLTVPPGTADGTYAIVGTLVSGEGSVAVGGETTITVSTAGPQLVEQEFSGSLAKGEREPLLTPDIPAGVIDLEITLEATADIDLELYDGDTLVIGWHGEIDSKGATTGTYEGDDFAYSGYDDGDESITADGPLGRAYTLGVYGYKAGDYEVTVSYTVPPDVDVTPPEITITAPDSTVGSPVTITVSATDPSGVAYIWFGVWPDEYVLTGTEADWYEAIANAGGPGGEVSLTFTPSSANSYYVAAWASDMLGNPTPDLAPETATWVVTE